MKKRVDNLFPTQVAVIDTESQDLCKKYADIVLSQMTDDNKVELETYSNWCTSDNLHTSADFKELVDLIDITAKDFFDDVLGIDNDDLTLSSMWSNVSKRDTQHQIHQHPNSYFSGVLYLNAPENSGNLIFVDPRPTKNMAHADFKKESGISSRSWQYTPETGLLILFPSWLEHGTQRSRILPNENRISLSFNYTLLKCSGHTMSFNFKAG